MHHFEPSSFTRRFAVRHLKSLSRPNFVIASPSPVLPLHPTGTLLHSLALSFSSHPTLNNDEAHHHLHRTRCLLALSLSSLLPSLPSVRKTHPHSQPWPLPCPPVSSTVSPTKDGHGSTFLLPTTPTVTTARPPGLLRYRCRGHPQPRTSPSTAADPTDGRHTPLAVAPGAYRSAVPNSWDTRRGGVCKAWAYLPWCPLNLGIIKTARFFFLPEGILTKMQERNKESACPVWFSPKLPRPPDHHRYHSCLAENFSENCELRKQFDPARNFHFPTFETEGRASALINMSGRWISLFFLVSRFIMLTCGSVGGRTSGFEAEIDNAIAQIIQDQNGDTFCCFDIERQPGSEGHQVQMEPSSFPDFVAHRRRRKSSSHVELPMMLCPPGTVPIQRTTEQKRERSVTSYTRFVEHHSANNSLENDGELTYYYAAFGTAKGTYYGGRASIGVYGVDDVGPNQISGALVWLTDYKKTQDREVIAAGWLIDPQRYHDNQLRLTAFWRVNEKECYNTDCPGYVQLSSKITLGSVLPLAAQTYLTVTISKDPQTHVWWLMIGDDPKVVGYWHAGLFSSLAESCAQVKTGGVVASPPKIFSPMMGNGHFPAEGVDICAIVTNVLLVEKDNSFLIAPQLFEFRYVDRYECYGLGKLIDGGKDNGPSFGYGGIGGCTA